MTTTAAPEKWNNLDSIIEIVQSPKDEDSFRRLIDWLRGKDLDHSSRPKRPSRIRTARSILDVLRAAFPTLSSEPNSGTGNDSTATIVCPSPVKRVESSPSRPLNSLPPAPPPTNTAAFPPLIKKPKRRIRPATLSTTPLTTAAANGTSTLSNAWAQAASHSSAPTPSSSSTGVSAVWPLPKGEELLERRLCPAAEHATEPTATPRPALVTPTKAKPIVATSTPLSPTPHTPTNQLRITGSPSTAATTPTMMGGSPATTTATRQVMDPIQLQQRPPSDMLRRWVELYTTLVESLLVPSTPNEVVFVLRILHGATTQASWKQPPPRPSMPPNNVAVHFSSPDDSGDDDDEMAFRVASVHFATLVLTHWADRLVGWGMARPLVECPPLQQYCPSLVTTLRDSLVRSDLHCSSQGSQTRRTAFWTLPFDEMRDSRNRYRTPGELALYKNREETRDIFLSHLRNFYHQGGQPSVSQSHAMIPEPAARVRRAVRAVMDNLTDDNLPWLAELFTDMLLQLGSVPVQETDRDVLKMASLDKVQKLHQRFKAPARKGSRAPTGRHSKRSAPRTAETEGRTISVQEEYFRGHQEFFYYFMALADSHKLNFHLKHQFLKRITALSTQLVFSNIDRDLEDLCLLGHFLGVLVFSPNWHSASVSLDESRSRSLVYDEFGALQFGGANAMTLLREGSQRCRLVSVLPWVVGLLRMSLWDDSFRQTASFSDMVPLLRRIQHRLAARMHPASVPCREYLLLALESFMDEIVGLDVAENYDKRSLEESDISVHPDEANGLDSEVLSLEQSTILSVNARTESAVHLVTDINAFSRGLRRSSGVSRKVRPSTLMSVSTRVDQQPKSPAPELDHNAQIQRKLKASFFHLHREIQLICDFAMERTEGQVYKLWKQANVHVISPLQPEDSIDWDKTENDLIEAYDEILREKLQWSLQRSLELYSAESHKEVKRIAVALSMDEGMKNGRPKRDAMAAETISNAKSKLEKLAVKKRNSALTSQSTY